MTAKTTKTQKPMTAQQIARKFHLAGDLWSDRTHHQALEAILGILGHPMGRKVAFEAEGAYIARRIFGMEDWQGLLSDIKHYSGFCKEANAELAKWTADWTIKESPIGDGFSIYHW